jgi:hypothetical protein
MITHITARGHAFECWFEFEPGEPATCIDPGWPDAYYLISATTGGVNVTEILDPAIVHELEQRAREQ